MKETLILKLSDSSVREIEVELKFNTTVCLGLFDDDWVRIKEADFELSILNSNIKVVFEKGAYFHKGGVYYDYTDPKAQKLLKE